MSEQYSQQPGQHQKATEDEISLLDLAVTLAKHKKLILGLPIFAALVAAVVTLFIPSSYTATIRILPTGGSIPKETIISLLNSQPISDSLIQSFLLQKVYRTPSLSATRSALKAAVKIAAAKDGAIEVSVDDKSPKRAALMANSYYNILQHNMHNYGLTEVSQRRFMLEKLLPDAKKVLDQAESDLNRARRSSGIDEPDARAEELVRASADLKAKIAMKELELIALGTLDPAKNPNYFRTQQELSVLWSEFATVDNAEMTMGRVSEAELDYLRKIRAFKYNETRYEQLIKQIEVLKVDEVKETPLLQVLEKADVPEHKSKPKRALVAVISALATGILVMIWVFVSEALQKSTEDEASAARIQLLRRYLRWK
jgi:uncharacterized protein involved in exopolysaccharide biosynthesis